MGVAMEMGVVTEEEESNGGLQAKKLCSIPASMETGSDEQGHDLNLPIPGEKGLPCLVKVGSDALASADSALLYSSIEILKPLVLVVWWKWLACLG